MIDIREKARELRAEIGNMSAGTINEDQIDVLKETAKVLVTAIEEWYAAAPAAEPAEPVVAAEPVTEESHEEIQESEESASEEGNEEEAEESSSRSPGSRSHGRRRK